MDDSVLTAEPVTVPAARDTVFSARSQTIVVWWSLVFGVIFAGTLIGLLHMLPPPDADMSADQVAQWYSDRDTQIKIGATIASWTGAFLMPYWAVLGIQMSRQERGRPIWTVLALLGGALVTVVIVLPPVCWGVAAFTPDRDPQITQVMHELGCLMFITTDQFFIFAWVALAVICFRPQVAERSPFSRSYGYFTAWTAMLFETGALAYNFKSEMASWNGLLPFWIPFVAFGIWMVVTTWLLLTRLKAQRIDAARTESAPTLL